VPLVSSKPLGAILFSTQNIASLNIISHLGKNWNWLKENEKKYYFSICGKGSCKTGLRAIGYDLPIIEIEPDFDAGYYLYASTHKSAQNTPSLTAHICGNWGAADFGGEPKTLNMAYACKLKQILKFLREGALREKLSWEACLEVDHHGPTPNNGSKPLIFVEIGSSEKEWGNELAGKIVAEAIMKSLVREAPAHPAYLAFGGGHYAPKFNAYEFGDKKIGGREIALSHICPKYRVDELDEAMVLQAYEKSIEPIEGALIDWKGLTQEQREKIISILEKLNIKWMKA
jgi:D-aminoacyl-tRNA deacylase